MYQKAVFSILWCVLCVYQLSFADDIYTDVNDYIKREHSLVKPYQGNENSLEPLIAITWSIIYLIYI